jgi:ubiquinol-cytochrome c reductase cytochrome b subunit
MNQLGTAGHPVPGTLTRPDPPEQSTSLATARAAARNGHRPEEST